jgi:hypothetical protein
VGRYVTPGVSYHTDVRINAARNLMVINVDEPGATVAQGVGPGVEIVDIRDLAAPRMLSAVPGLGGPHKLALIGDRHIYTTLPTFIIDYTDPAKPTSKRAPIDVCGHAFAVDPNDPTTAYAGACSRYNWLVLDVSSPAEPRVVSKVNDLGIDVPHEAVPSADSSFVAVSDLRNDYTQTTCPGGGLHFYDISGRYTSPDEDGPASRSNPIKMGQWFPPFTGASQGPSQTGPWASCTAHGVQLHHERMLLSDAHYFAGGWIMDPRQATRAGGPFTEYSAKPAGSGLGPTTWGRTLANWTLPSNMSWYQEWAPFDDPAYDRVLFSVSPDRGLDVLRYTGPLPRKVARLDARVQDGTVTGSLSRRPVLTPQGMAPVPLGGQELTVSWGGTPFTVTTKADGTFSAPLPAGAGPVLVSWAGGEDFEGLSTTAS